MGRCGFECARGRLGNGAVLALIRTIVCFHEVLDTRSRNPTIRHECMPRVALGLYEHCWFLTLLL
jgi:hypothetical protein